MNKKTIIIALLIILVLIIFIAIKKDKKQNNQEITENNQEILVQTLEDGTKLNTSTKILETKKIENLEISNSQLTNKEGKTILLADVKNVGSTTIQMIQLEITLVDSNQKEIEKLLEKVNDDLSNKEKMFILGVIEGLKLAKTAI